MSAPLGLPDDLPSFEGVDFTAYVNSDNIRFQGRTMHVTLVVLPEDVEGALVLRNLGGQAIPISVQMRVYEDA